MPKRTIGAHRGNQAVLHASGVYGTARRYGRPAAEVDDAHRALATEQIAAYVEQVVADAPPLTDEQRDRIATLLRPKPAA